MDEKAWEQFFGEMRALKEQLAGVMKFVKLESTADDRMSCLEEEVVAAFGLGAVPYARAAVLLGVHVSEVKLMVRQSILLSVTYAPGKRPKIPLSEIRRLTTPVMPLEPKQRGKPSRRRQAADDLTEEELDAAMKNR